MKLATLKDSTRDGKLVVVSKDLTRCSEVGIFARTLQAALDDWAHAGPRWSASPRGSRPGRSRPWRSMSTTPPRRCRRPFSGRTDSAYVNHVRASSERRAMPRCRQVLDRSADLSGRLRQFLGPRDPILMADDGWGIDMEGEIAVIVDDVPTGATLEDSKAAIRARHARQRCLPAQASFLENSPRDSASINRSRLPPFSRSP